MENFNMSFKRIKLQRENDMSSGVLEVEGDITTLISFNSEVGTDTINVNNGGKVVIVNRDSTFAAKPEYKSWIPTLSIASPADNGNFIIYVDSTGLVKIANVNNNSKLPAFDEGSIDMNNSVQLGTYTMIGGNISSGVGVIQWIGNTGNRIFGMMDSLGVINDLTLRVATEVVDGTLNLAIKGGKAASRSAGALDSEITKKADTVFVPDVSPSIIAIGDRNNVILSFGFVVDTENYESSIGTISPIPSDKSVNSFFVVFPNNQFIGMQYGQVLYNTPLLAQESFETPEFSEVGANAISTIKLSFNEGEVNLSSALKKILPRLS